MHTMLLRAQGRPLVPADLDRPQPGPRQVLIRVAACAVCRTDLHVVDGDLREPKLPLVPGHEIVGRVERLRRRGGSRSGGRSGRGALARLDLRGVRVLPQRAGEPVRARAVHRLPDRRRLRSIHRGG